MKNTLKNILIAIAIISAPFATFAAQKKAEYQLPTYTIEDIAALPEATHNPIPSVSSRFVGLDLQVKFTVSAQGKPENVRLAKPLSSYSEIHKMSFASQMENAVKNWKFEPAIDTAGNAISVNVVMPVQVVKKSGKATAIASLIFDSGKTDRS